MTERWLPVVGFEGKYEVSDLGRVRSLDRIEHAIKAGKPYTRSLRGKILKIIPKDNGYQQVNLGRDNPQQVHTLILTTFVGPKPAGEECRHLNGIKAENVLTNLKWGTPLENSNDAVLHGVKPRGEKIGNSKLKEPDVCSVRSSEEPTRVLAAVLGVAKSTVIRARNKRTWGHVR